MYKLLIVIMLFTFSSCCDDPVQDGRFPLTDEEKEYVTYVVSDTLTYTYSNGFEFDMRVILKDNIFKREDEEHRYCSKSYFIYENQLIRIASNVPQFQFDIELNAEVDFPFIKISINDYAFPIYRDMLPEFDTISINGYLFKNVYNIPHSYPDSMNIIPSGLLYSKEDGIIQITMSDNEKITLKK